MFSDSGSSDRIPHDDGSRYYSIHHTTHFQYNAAICESIMEVRKQPRNDSWQTCLAFEFKTEPYAHPSSYDDALDNAVHLFNIPAYHTSLSVKTYAQVRVDEPPDLPDALLPSAWDEIDEIVDGDHRLWEFTQPSRFPKPTTLLRQLADELNVASGRSAHAAAAHEHGVVRSVRLRSEQHAGRFAH